MTKKLKVYLQLCRIANLPTAAADILAGAAIAGFFVLDLGAMADVDLPYFLLISTIFLYAGGVVLNDFYDAELDAVERPERPIPSGVVTKREVAILGFLLLVFGVVVAFLNSFLSGGIAAMLALAIIAYDAISKKHDVLGPLNMGLCRALNLLMGISVVGDLPKSYYVLIPFVFIGAVTLISRGEVHGNNKKNIVLSGIFYTLTIGLVVLFTMTSNNAYFEQAIVFLLLFGIMVFFPLVKAYRENVPLNIMKAVKFGVLALIPLNAAIAVGQAGWPIGLLVLLLLPLSVFLSKLFAVT